MQFGLRDSRQRARPFGEDVPARGRSQGDKMSNESTLAAQLRRSIDESLSRLATAVDNQRRSEEVTRYLDTMARFPTYSWRNAYLILMQRPQASLVAGYSQWRRLGRMVRQGEKAIRIISPCPIRKTTNTEDERVRVFFKTACVFDVAQTEGKDIPAAQVPEIQVDANALFAAVGDVAANRGIAVRYERMEEGTFGVSSGGTIVIATGHATGQQCKTLIHELAHESLHQRSGEGCASYPARAVAELEAEAVAYVVSRHFGLDVELRASRYIALWGGNGKTLATRLERISVTARGLIEDLQGSTQFLGGKASCPSVVGKPEDVTASTARQPAVTALPSVAE